MKHNESIRLELLIERRVKAEIIAATKAFRPAVEWQAIEDELRKARDAVSYCINYLTRRTDSESESGSDIAPADRAA